MTLSVYTKTSSLSPDPKVKTPILMCRDSIGMEAVKAEKEEEDVAEADTAEAEEEEAVVAGAAVAGEATSASTKGEAVMSKTGITLPRNTPN
jgi:hypothetical protein